MVTSFKLVTERAVTCNQICDLKRSLIYKEPTVRELIERDLPEFKIAEETEFKRCAEKQTLDFTLEGLLYGLGVFKRAAEHHIYLKFELKDKTVRFHNMTDE